MFFLVQKKKSPYHEQPAFSVHRTPIIRWEDGPAYLVKGGGQISAGIARSVQRAPSAQGEMATEFSVNISLSHGYFSWFYKMVSVLIFTQRIGGGKAQADSRC